MNAYANAVLSCDVCLDGIRFLNHDPWKVAQLADDWIEAHASECDGPISSISWTEPELPGFTEGSVPNGV